eukprot:1012016_1
MHILAIYQFGEDASMDVILVSGMDGYGKILTSSSTEEVDEVTSKFTIDDVKFVDSPRSIYNNNNGNCRVQSRASVNIVRAVWMRTRDETGTEVETIRFLLRGFPPFLRIISNQKWIISSQKLDNFKSKVDNLFLFFIFVHT